MVHLCRTLRTYVSYPYRELSEFEWWQKQLILWYIIVLYLLSSWCEKKSMLRAHGFLQIRDCTPTCSRKVFTSLLIGLPVECRRKRKCVLMNFPSKDRSSREDLLFFFCRISLYPMTVPLSYLLRQSWKGFLRLRLYYLFSLE